MFRIGRWFLAGSALLCRFAFVTVAAAEAPLPIRLTLRDCDGRSEAALRELLAIEFKTLGVSSSEAPETVALTCSGDQAFVALSSAASAIPAERHVDMAGTPPAERARLLSLAISELVVEARARAVSAAPPAPVRRSTLRPPEPSSPARSERRFNAWLTPALSLRRVGKPGAWLFGAELSGELAFARNLHGALALHAETGEMDLPAAAITITSWAGSAAVLLAAETRRFEFAMGPALQLGRLAVTARSSVPEARGASAAALWGGPLLSARVRYRVGPRAFVQLNAGAGVLTWKLRGTTNEGAELSDFSGAFASLALGFGLNF